jgi:hypothetical protein
MSGSLSANPQAGLSANPQAGKPLWGLTLAQNLSRQTRLGGEEARLVFVVLDLAQAISASALGEPDARLPLALWPQAIADSKWVKMVAGDYAGRVGGVHAGAKSVYRSRALWNTGAEKTRLPDGGQVVCDRFYVTQPSANGESTRLYFFMLTMPLSQHAAGARWLEDFVGNFSMPETPMQPILAKAPEALNVAAQSASAGSCRKTLQPMSGRP